MLDFWIAVDGGGTGTRVLLTRAHGAVIGHGHAGPSALGQGIEAAWIHIVQAVQQAFAEAGLPYAPAQVAMGAGLSGVNNLAWREAFIAANPGFGSLLLASDATTMLLGAHGGRPGAMVAAGTGSVGEALHPDGSRTTVGGWGFPVGDEGSGAWLGLQAMRLAQAALDGRATATALTHAVLQQCGNQRSDLQAWCAQAGQGGYASLAPMVFASQQQDTAANALVCAAANELERIALALDPAQRLPVAFCGSIGQLLKTHVSVPLQARLVEPQSGATDGALELLKKKIGNMP
jgi:glucosamine kinase